MPELDVVAPVGPDPDVLLAAVASAVLAVPGVVRLEPTLSTSGPGLLIHRSPTDGVRLTTRSGTTEVDVSIATTAGCPARAVAQQVRAGVADLLTTYGHRSAVVTVSVLAIEPAPAA